MVFDKSFQDSRTYFWLQSLLNSYSLIFFSLNNVLAALILVVSFFAPAVGLCGLLAVVIVNLFAYLIGYNREEIKGGVFGFNAVFLGLSLGYEYSFNFEFGLLFITAMFVLLLMTTLTKGFLAIYNLPFLSLPFILTNWIISLASSNLSNVHLDASHAFVINELALNQASSFYQLVHSLDGWEIAPFILIYLKTIAGTFFQSSVLGGILISLGLLYSSRIAFSLSVIGFAFAFAFYSLFGADVNDLTYYLLGSNFIFLAIAIGCFFLIPNTYSYITVIIFTPVLMLVLISFGKLLAVFTLKAYTLSFSLLAIAFLFSINQRWLLQFLHIATIQYFSAETTIYKYLTSLKRFKNEGYAKVALPCNGEWFVSQGHDGGITHLGAWGKALDFVIVDSEENTYRLPANKPEHFYCYDKEVTAPLDGFVYDIINNVEDNDIGGVNTESNWGNTIIINHLNGLFSQSSHIKKDSYRVVIGQFVSKGEVLATCGNSGRSPEPHIHFQLQTKQAVGSETLYYPISYFIQRKGEERTLHISEVPDEEAHISNVQTNEILINSFDFLPGVKMTFENEATKEQVHWEVLTDAYNRTYISCAKTKSTAYFVNDGVMIYFTDFEGDKKSLLFHFYLAAYRQLLGYYETVKTEDKVPLIHFNTKLVQFFQDFVAPFYLFTRANYSSKFTYVDNIYAPQNVKIASTVEAKAINYLFKKLDFELELVDNKIARFTVKSKNKKESFICV